MNKVRTEEGFAKAMKDEESTIEIEGDLAKKIIRIRATGNVAWAIALGSIAIAVGALIMTARSRDLKTATASGFVAFAAAPAAVSTLGFSVSKTALAIAIAAGGVGVLTKVREYEEIKRADGLLILRVKS